MVRGKMNKFFFSRLAHGQKNLKEIHHCVIIHRGYRTIGIIESHRKKKKPQQCGKKNKLSSRKKKLIER